MGIYVAWSHFGIEETRFDVDANAIHDALADVISVWPAEDIEPITVDLNDRTTLQVEVPSGGWFESAADTLKLPPPDSDAPRRVNFAYVAEPEKSTETGGPAAPHKS